jgi:hypothetical protein
LNQLRCGDSRPDWASSPSRPPKNSNTYPSSVRTLRHCGFWDCGFHTARPWPENETQSAESFANGRSHKALILECLVKHQASPRLAVATAWPSSINNQLKIEQACNTHHQRPTKGPGLLYLNAFWLCGTLVIAMKSTLFLRHCDPTILSPYCSERAKVTLRTRLTHTPARTPYPRPSPPGSESGDPHVSRIEPPVCRFGTYLLSEPCAGAIALRKFCPYSPPNAIFFKQP